MRTLLYLLICLLPAGLAAEEYRLETVIGVEGSADRQGTVAPPFTPLVVRITRTDTRPLRGRVVVELARSSRGRMMRAATHDVELVQEIDLADGVPQADVRFELPVFSNTLEGRVSLETARGAEGTGYEPLVVREFSAGVKLPGKLLVAFVSQARLGSMHTWVYQDLVEVQPDGVPDNWKLLACFDAVILNDERLTRGQSQALVDYVAAGGILLISPTSEAAFNPELPLARLLGATLARREGVAVGEFQLLRELPKAAGPRSEETSTRERRRGAPVPEPEPDTPPVPVPASNLPTPDADAVLDLWRANGRAVQVPEFAGLISRARFGAGSVYLIHADVSQFPLATTGAREGTLPGVSLLTRTLTAALPASSRHPLGRMLTGEPRNVIEIAGKRILNRDIQILMVLVYVMTAGFGLFLLARRVRRPELYPAGLLALAVLSVVLVFSMDALFKRTGERAHAARIIVADGATGHNAVFTLGCAYVHEENRVQFAQDRGAWLMPVDDGRSAMRGLPTDHVDYDALVSALDTVTTVSDLDRWQNLFFATTEPATIQGLAISLTSDGGSYTVENTGSQELTGCLLLIGRGGSPLCEWHYLPALAAAGSPDARVPLSQATLAAKDSRQVGEQMRHDARAEQAGDFLTALLGLARNDALPVPREARDVEGQLDGMGLLPIEGEFLVIGVMSPEAVSKGSLGLRALQPERIGQSVIGAVRGQVITR